MSIRNENGGGVGSIYVNVIAVPQFNVMDLDGGE
jgi:hypothetical protein